VVEAAASVAAVEPDEPPDYVAPPDPIEKKEHNLKSRVITGAVFSISFVVLVVVHEWTTVVACSALAVLCAIEFYAMLRSDAKLPNELIGTITAGAYPIVYQIWHFDGLLITTVISATVLLVWYAFYVPSRITDVAVTLFGSCYTGLMLTSLIQVREVLPSFWGGLLVFGVLLSVWANDAFAWFFGSRFGKHKLAPRISPKKTWEGFLFGLFASMAVWVLMSFLPGFALGWGWALFLGFVCGIFGVLGDLVESRIKRSTGHKDSGNLLPGHGGFLDRCDSLLIVGAVTIVIFRVMGIG
jgi:phosphatidate cytidylyltransferase